MAVPAGQDGASRLRNGMMLLRTDLNTTWHMYGQKHTSPHPPDLRLYEDIQPTVNQVLNFSVKRTVRSFLACCGGLTFTVSWWGEWQFEPFQEAQSEVTPQHWHDRLNRWNYGFPMGWPLFPGLLGAHVCLPVGYGSDGHLSLTRLLPGKSPSFLKMRLATS